MISVDGDMSTNDACTPSRRRATVRRDARLPRKRSRGRRDLAVRDGARRRRRDEDARVQRRTGARRRAGARDRARGDQHSLVKTALYGEDPNWGRIIAAAGAAARRTRSREVVARSAASSWVDRGAIEALSEAEAHLLLDGANDRDHARPRHRRPPRHRLGLRLLSTDYVRINAHYRT
jgi:glutamate N-acetyltransferase/amino-acid N-acetyltransferase